MPRSRMYCRCAVMACCNWGSSGIWTGFPIDYMAGERTADRLASRACLAKQFLPNSARGYAHHRLTRLAAKGFLERSRVLHNAVDAPASRRMWVGEGENPRLLISYVLAPDLAVRDEEALLRRVTVHRLYLCVAHKIQQGHVRQFQ